MISKGGFTSMLYAISIVICAMMFGRHHGGDPSTQGHRRPHPCAWPKSSGSLITSTVLTCLGANLVLCDQYMAIVMGGRMYAQAYRDRGLHAKNLSRAVEDSATVTANLVPWNSGGVYQAGVLGVPTIVYLPFNFFCWLSPLVTLVFGWAGWTIHPLDKAEEQATAAETAPAE